MANSLRTKLKKLAHDGKINQQELDDLLKKLDGHDRELQIPKWHLCSEELPKTNGWYLTKYKNLKDNYLYGVLLYDKEEWKIPTYLKVFAWTELPKFESEE